MPESINNSAERNFPKEEKNPPLLPDFEGFTFTLSPAEERQYKDYTPRSIKIIKYLEALNYAVLIRAFKEIEDFASKGRWGPTLDLLQRQFGGNTLDLLQGQLGGRERVNPDWLTGVIARIVEEKRLTSKGSSEK